MHLPRPIRQIIVTPRLRVLHQGRQGPGHGPSPSGCRQEPGRRPCRRGQLRCHAPDRLRAARAHRSPESPEEDPACLFRYENDPEPEQPLPAGRLYVPVRPGNGERTAIRLFRTPLGARTAVGFTSRQRLVATLGEGQAAVLLSESVLRALRVPLGAHLLDGFRSRDAGEWSGAESPEPAAPLRRSGLPHRAERRRGGTVPPLFRSLTYGPRQENRRTRMEPVNGAHRPAGPAVHFCSATPADSTPFTSHRSSRWPIWPSSPPRSRYSHWWLSSRGG
ncbi:SAV_915 family protein [Streptomyces sp. NPDC056749]|uniref:SAV_915 family protein n=1 Tax=Streptomyces sp. NPDC056749 TaxID=3345936 RepID=UPI0036BF3A68